MDIIWDSLISILSFSPVLVIASLGGLLSQRVGIYNIGMEGIMAFGGISGILAFLIFPSVWMSLAFGLLGGAVFGVLLYALAERLRLDQIVVGFGIWFLAEGAAGAIYMLFPKFQIPSRLDPVLFSLDPVFYLSLALVVGFTFLLSKTVEGVKVKAVGNNPRIADIAGINVGRTRFVYVTAGSALVGLAGSYLAANILQGFTYQMVAGYGWIAFALVILGGWKISTVFVSAIFFGGMIGLATRLQVWGVQLLPPEFMVVIPHIGVIVAIVLTRLVGKRAAMPTALGKPYIRED